MSWNFVRIALQKLENSSMAPSKGSKVEIRHVALQSDLPCSYIVCSKIEDIKDFKGAGSQNLRLVRGGYREQTPRKHCCDFVADV